MIRNIRRQTLVVLLLLFVCLLAGTATLAAEPRQGGTLTIGRALDIQSFDPTGLPLGNWPMYNQIYNTLVRYDGSFNVLPELAVNWELSGDGMELDLELRPNVMFHNGRQFIARDVKFTIERYQDAEVGANMRPLALSVTEVVIHDDYNLTLRFEEPNPTVFDFLDLMFIQNEETIDEITNQPVGTGPFVLARWAPGSEVVFERFEDYWREDRPYLDRVVLRVLANEPTLLANLQSGRVDLAAGLSNRAFSELEASGRYETSVGALGNLVSVVVMNVEQPPFDNPMVREAVNYAVNRERFARLYFQGLVEPWTQLVPAYSLAYDPSLEGRYHFDLERARSLLEDSGVPLPIRATVVASSLWPGGVELATIMQADLRTIGFELTIQELEPAVARPKIFDGDFEMINAIYGRAQKDPALLFGSTIVWRDTNGSQFRSPEYDGLINRAATLVDSEERRRLYQQLSAVALDENFAIPIAPFPTTWVAQPRVQGYTWTLDNMEVLENVWLDD